MYQYGARSRIANMMLEKIKNDEKLNGLNQTKVHIEPHGRSCQMFSFSIIVDIFNNDVNVCVCVCV